jgi:hypothetical protein
VPVAASLGQAAYEAYVEHCGGKSIRGEDLPPWDGQDPAIRAHWEAAAEGVRANSLSTSADRGA